MPASDRICLVLALGAAAFIGFVELHSTEVTPTVGLIVLAASLLGFARRRWHWVWGTLIGAAVPAAYVFAAVFGVTPREWPQPEGFATDVGVGTFTLAAGLIASALGAMLSKASSRLA